MRGGSEGSTRSSAPRPSELRLQAEVVAAWQVVFDERVFGAARKAGAVFSDVALVEQIVHIEAHADFLQTQAAHRVAALPGVAQRGIGDGVRRNGGLEVRPVSLAGVAHAQLGSPRADGVDAAQRHRGVWRIRHGHLGRGELRVEQPQVGVGRPVFVDLEIVLPGDALIHSLAHVGQNGDGLGGAGRRVTETLDVVVEVDAEYIHAAAPHAEVVDHASVVGRGLLRGEIRVVGAGVVLVVLRRIAVAGVVGVNVDALCQLVVHAERGHGGREAGAVLPRSTLGFGDCRIVDEVAFGFEVFQSGLQGQAVGGLEGKVEIGLVEFG